MQTVAVISQKGGAGKTTLAVNLAVTAEKKGKSVLLLDLDPQASSASWKDSRAAETPVVVAAPASRLSQYLETGRQNGADFAIIDTAPHSENAALESARAADLALIPCRAGILDIRAIQYEPQHLPPCKQASLCRAERLTGTGQHGRGSRRRPIRSGNSKRFWATDCSNAPAARSR